MSDSMLIEALQQSAAREAPAVAEPQPLVPDGQRAVGPELTAFSPATGDGVTVDRDEAPLSFEDAYLAETLGVEPEPGDDEEPTDAAVAAPAESDPLAVAEARIAELEAERVMREAESHWSNKWAEGQVWAESLMAEIEAWGEANNRSDAEIERAKNRAMVADIIPWINDYHQAKAAGIAVAQDAAAGKDQVSQLIRQHGLSDADRPALLKYIANPDLMATTAELLAAERSRVAARHQSVVSQATRNVAKRLSQEAVVPQGPGSSQRPAPRVQGSDAELDFMIRNRPTLRRVAS